MKFNYIIKSILFLLVTVFFRFILRESLTQLTLQFEIIYFFENGWKSKNLDFVTNIIYYSFIIIYIIISLVYYIKKVNIAYYIISTLDLILIIIAIYYIPALLAGMKQDPGNAGLAIMLFPIPIILIVHSLFSLYLNNILCKQFCLKST